MKQISRQYRFGRFWFDAVQGDLQLDGVPVAARPQALGLLAALLAQPGALVTKDDLMRAAWPGLHVEDGNISVQIYHLRQLLRDTGKPHRWIATAPGRGYRFIGQVETSPAPGRAQASAQEPAIFDAALSAPAAPGPIIGRERELAALQAAMPGQRLVTITGPGGMGKTRLAMEFAREHAGDPLNKILFLALEGLRQKDQILFRLAARLGVQLADGPQLAKNLGDMLRAQPYFLIFDNCEHVREEVAALVATILDRAPGVGILATSREPLKLPAEVVFALGPLDFPASAEPLSRAQAGSFPAVQLFAEIAHASDPGFRLNDATANDVARICRKVEGIPLALTLAAAGLHTVSLPALADGLATPGRLPPSSRHGVPARHRSVEATIAWSVALLSSPERAALRRLSVFAGGFTLQGAQAVIAGDMIDSSDVADLIASLCEKSLLVAAPGYEAANRFRLLESTRHYAQEMLTQAGETAAFRHSLAKRMVAVVSRAREVWPNADAEAWRKDYEPEIENLRAALDWAFAPGGNAAIAVALTAPLSAFFADRLITIREYLTAVRAALVLLAPETPGEIAGWVRLSASADLGAGLHACADLAVLAVDCFRSAGNPVLAGYALARACALFAFADDRARAPQYRTEAIAALPLLPANRYRSAALLNFATSLAHADDKQSNLTALEYFAEALPIARKFNDQTQVALIGANLAELEAVLEKYDAAIERSGKLASESRARRDLRRLSHDLLNLLNYNLLANRLDAARDAAREVIPLLVDIDDLHWGADTVGRLAMLAARVGDWKAAAKLAGFSEYYFTSNKKSRPATDRRLWDRLMTEFAAAAESGALAEPERLALMACGGKLTLEQALNVVRFCSGITDHLD